MIRSGLLLAAFVFSASSVWAQQQFRLDQRDGKGPVEVRAESISAAASGRQLSAVGSVAVSWEGYRLHADRVTYDRETSLADATGSVVLEDRDGNILRCSHLSVNVETQQGVAEEGTLWIAREGYKVWGKRFERKDEVSYAVQEGGVTACDGTWPSWRVNASRIHVQLEGYLRASHAVFWVEGLPSLYTPYVVFPVKRQRQSGFLIPKIGLSSRDGLILAARYYWAFSDSADVTAGLEYRSRRGWLETAELRYVVAEGHEGTLFASHIYDRQDEANRYNIKMDHQSRFDDVTRVKLHVDYVGDKKLLRDLGDTIDQRGIERKEDYLIAARGVDSGTLFGLAKYVQALQEPQGPVLQILPRLGIEGRETPILGALALDPTVRFTNFYREEGEEGQRLEISPKLAWDSRFGGLGVSARAGYRENLYHVDGELLGRGAALASLGALASFGRRYDAGLIHVVEPRLAWSWQDPAKGSEPPSFDVSDDFQSGSALGLHLASRLLRAADLSALAALDLERTVDLPAFGRYGWGERAFGPWRAELSVTPSERSRARLEGQYDPAVKDPWLQWSAEGEIKDGRGDRLFAGHHYLKGQASYLDAGVEIPLTAALSVQYRNRYSFRSERALEQAVGLHLLHQCWELLGTMSANYREDGGYESRFFLTAQLKGLGKLGTLRGIVP